MVLESFVLNTPSPTTLTDDLRLNLTFTVRTNGITPDVTQLSLSFEMESASDVELVTTQADPVLTGFEIQLSVQVEFHHRQNFLPANFILKTTARLGEYKNDKTITITR